MNNKYTKYPLLIILCLITSILLTGSVFNITVVTPDSYEGREIKKVIDILRKGGGDPNEVESPAYVANNIEKYLKWSLIRIDVLPSGETGRGYYLSGPIYIDPSMFLSTETNEGKGADPSKPEDFKKLVELLETLIHEKHHSETHNHLVRMPCALLDWLGLWNPMEIHSWIYEIQFLDRLAIAYIAQCQSIPHENIKDYSTCINQVVKIFQVKRSAVYEYNNSGYGPQLQSEFQTYLNIMYQFFINLGNQLEKQVKDLEDAKSRGASEQEVGMLIDDFSQENEQAYASSFNNIQELETNMEETYNEYNTISKEQFVQAQQTFTYHVVETIDFISTYTVNDPTKIYLVITIDQATHTLQEGNYPFFITYPGASFPAIPATFYEIPVEDIDYSIKIRLEDLAKIHISDTPEETAQELNSSRKITLQEGYRERTSTKPKLLLYFLLVMMGVVGTFALSALIILIRQPADRRVLWLILGCLSMSCFILLIGSFIYSLPFLTNAIANLSELQKTSPSPEILKMPHNTATFTPITTSTPVPTPSLPLIQEPPTHTSTSTVTSTPQVRLRIGIKHIQKDLIQVIAEFTGPAGAPVKATLSGLSVIGTQKQSTQISQDGYVLLIWDVSRLGKYKIEGTIAGIPVGFNFDVEDIYESDEP